EQLARGLDERGAGRLGLLELAALDCHTVLMSDTYCWYAKCQPKPIINRRQVSNEIRRDRVGPNCIRRKWHGTRGAIRSRLSSKRLRVARRVGGSCCDAAMYRAGSDGVGL